MFPFKFIKDLKTGQIKKLVNVDYLFFLGEIKKRIINCHIF